MKRNENGRSMIEILGVLAIIGVLSVGGIYGYKVAVQKHRANEIVQTASILATLSQSADGGEGDCIMLSNTSLPKNVAGIEIDMKADTKTDDTGKKKTTIDIKIVSDMSPSEEETLCNTVDLLINGATAYERDHCDSTSPLECK